MQLGSGTRYYYLSDGRGSITGVVDSVGTVRNSYRYSPWGQLEDSTESVANTVGFSGRDYDRVTGLYYHRARSYDPTLGRFIQEDPIGLGDGVNLFQYAAGDPINHRDPSGLDCRNSDGTERPCRVTWSQADNPDQNVRGFVLEFIQELADLAGLDLVLSSGRRQGPCYLTSPDGRGSAHNCGLAVDISGVGGVDIDQGDDFNTESTDLVARLIAIAQTMFPTREIYGPLGLLRNANEDGWVELINQALQDGHYDHLHLAFFPLN